MKKEKTYYYTFNWFVVTLLPIILLIVTSLFTLYLISLFNMTFTIEYDVFTVFNLLLLPYLVFHEILHSIGYVVNGASFDRITYGVHLEKGVLCCSCKQVVDKNNIMWSLMYPFLCIGVITYIIGFIIKSPVLIALSVFNISGCAGDLAMFFAFLRLKDFKFFEYDNPVGFGLITKEDMSKKKLFGLKQYEEKDCKQTVDKKVTISKISIIALIVYYILILIPLFL